MHGHMGRGGDVTGAWNKVVSTSIMLTNYHLPHVRRIMRPNTPHVVFTPDHSVVHGGHLYPRATLQDSLAGIIHCFVAGNWITNTNHTVARFHLQQMIVFCHMAIVEQDIWDDGK